MKNKLKQKSDSKPSTTNDCRALAIIDPTTRKINAEDASPEPIARLIKSQKIDYVNKEIQKNIIVQNSDEIAKEERLMEYMHKYDQEK